MRVRNSARLLLLNEDDHLFLFQFEDEAIVDPRNPNRCIFWATPGGGVDEGETFQEAAKRELWEETGITQFELGPWVWTREVQLCINGEMVLSHERYYLARVANVSVNFDNFTDLEKEVYRAHKWWTLDELSTTSQTIFPENIGEMLRPLIKGELPDSPVLIAL